MKEYILKSSSSKKNGSSFSGFFSSAKGYLFTISVILFASTLVWYSQAFAEKNYLDERLVIESIKPMSALYLMDDVGSDLESLFGVSFDLNESSSSSVLISGSISATDYLTSAIGEYSVFAASFFSRVSGSQSLDLSGVSDGKAEFFIGDSIGFDFDYSSRNVVLFPRENLTLSRIDLNIVATGDLLSTEFTNPGSGDVAFLLNYSDDSNVFSLSTTINPASVYSLKLIYADGNSFVEFGSVSGTSGVVSITARDSQQIDYVLSNSYSQELDLRPVRVNAVLVNSFEKFDSNGLVVIKK